MVQMQITRENHYVPQWYQRGFLVKGRHKLHVLNLSRGTEFLPSGGTASERELKEVGPKLAFVERDLYTTRLGTSLNDDIEKFLFGRIDKTGADAVRAWIVGDASKMHRHFQDFFEYLDAQKLRTPKGLDWILKHYRGLPHMELMTQMQMLRQMHCAMWSECVREIVSAGDSRVKFLVSDHPVTVFHPLVPLDTADYPYPEDPGVELVGSQTLFALDANHCLILTNLEYAEDPDGAALLSRRTNARFRGDTIARTDALIRGRKLSEEEVHAVNSILKSRARKHVAAGDPAWLIPEQHCALDWKAIARLLLPRTDLWKFGGEIYIGYKDGSSAYRDRFGRTSTAHEFLAKAQLKGDPAPEDPCGCGSGTSYRECCVDIAPRLRPSWRVSSIRERNLALIRAITDILLIDEGKNWLDVRRDLSDDQVRRIHEVYAALWPTDTRLVDLLPSRQGKRSRAVFLGMTDPRTLPARIIGMLAYVDELLVVNPFVNANAVREGFSPIHRPARFREQTLRSVLVLLMLEPYIRTGRVHLVPDPVDYDTGFRNEILAITKQIDDEIEIGPIDRALSRALHRDEMMRFIKRLSPEDLKAYVRRTAPADSTELTDTDLDPVVEVWKRELEEDPLSLLDPPPSSVEGGEYKFLKGFSRETGLYMATLTGAFVYTDSDTQWARLHETDGVHIYQPDPAAVDTVRRLEDLQFKVAERLQRHPIEPLGADKVRALLREVAHTLRADLVTDIDLVPQEEASRSPSEDEMVTLQVRASVPRDGFQRTDVSRLVLTFGRLEDVPPVRLALFLTPIPQSTSST